jgi:hypothetical protein
VALDRFAEGRAVDLAARERLAGRRYQVKYAADGVTVLADIVDDRPGGIAIIEVKASRSVKEDQIDDVTVQLHVARAAGEQVVAAELMHLEPECRAPDLTNLFVREDVTARAERRLPVVAKAITAAGRRSGGPCRKSRSAPTAGGARRMSAHSPDDAGKMCPSTT